MNRLCHDVLHIILDLLDSRTLRNLSGVNQFFRNQKEQFYYRHAFERQPVYRMDVFLKDEFSLPLFDTHLQTVMDYVQTRSDLFIAGGFPTQLYMGKVPKETSDIDVYLLTKEPVRDGQYLTSAIIDSVREILEWFEKTYTVICCIRVGPSVYSIHVREFNHPVQLIITTNGTPSEILSSFDNSHNRCGIYMGYTYIGMDTKISHQTHKTYFYTTPKPCRYQKAIDLGFHPVGLTETEIERISAFQETYPYLILQKMNIPWLLSILGKVRAHRNWKINYADGDSSKYYYDTEEVDIEKEVPCRWKTICSAERPLLRMQKLRKLQYVYRIKGILNMISIEVTDPEEIKRVKTIRKNLIEFGITDHYLSEDGKDIGLPMFRTYNQTTEVVEIGKGEYECRRFI